MGVSEVCGWVCGRVGVIVGGCVWRWVCGCVGVCGCVCGWVCGCVLVCVCVVVVVVVRTVQLVRCVCPYPSQMHLIMGAVSLWTRPPALHLCAGP